jgi:hypothetical protein
MFFSHLSHGATNQTETELANRKLLSVTTASASAGTTEYQTLSPPRSAFLRQGDKPNGSQASLLTQNGSGRLCTGLDLDQ